jgi:hypothetical protein
MAGVLSFSDYIGGPDEVIAAQSFPSDQKSYLYNFGVNITGWTFTADFQTIVVDAVTFNRFTGQPNFSNSRVIGFFPEQKLLGSDAPVVINAAAGTVQLRIPAGMYTGAIRPDARSNVPVVVVSLTWQDVEPYPNIQTHRWAFVQAWEPDVEVGDPTQDNNFTAL